MIFAKNSVLVNLQYVVIILLIVKAEKLHDLNSARKVENSILIWKFRTIDIFSYLKNTEFLKNSRLNVERIFEKLKNFHDYSRFFAIFIENLWFAKMFQSFMIFRDLCYDLWFLWNFTIFHDFSGFLLIHIIFLFKKCWIFWKIFLTRLNVAKIFWKIRFYWVIRVEKFPH